MLANAFEHVFVVEQIHGAQEQVSKSATPRVLFLPVEGIDEAGVSAWMAIAERLPDRRS